MDRRSLPEYTVDVYPDEAARIESIRRLLLDFYRMRGFRYVIPSMVEFEKSLRLNKTEKFEARIFSLFDPLSGELLGLRPDITPQVARMDTALNSFAEESSSEVSRYCYGGSVLHSVPDGLFSSREPFQLGCEIFGGDELTHDVEAQLIALESLNLLNIRSGRINVTHRGIFLGLCKFDSLLQERQAEVISLLRSKNVDGIKRLEKFEHKQTLEALVVLSQLYGNLLNETEIFNRAEEILPRTKTIENALGQFSNFLKAIKTDLRFENSPNWDISIDLADLDGYHYHTGIMFSIYTKAWHEAVLRGGRYHRVETILGDSRSAVGFSFDIKQLSALSGANTLEKTREKRKSESFERLSGGNTIIVIGTQWGDEGKGKIVDLLTNKVDGVVRFQGGHNAGHTLIVDGQKVVLSLIPSGVLHEGVQCYIGNGVVLSLGDLIHEINSLEELGFGVLKKLKISYSCPLVLPTHILLDSASENQMGNEKIGTTKRGIGPAYEDKIARRALKLSDLNDMKVFREKLSYLINRHKLILESVYGFTDNNDSFNVEKTYEIFAGYSKTLTGLSTDVSTDLYKGLQNGKKYLFEGAQGSLLDIDHGTYPFVTSSNCVAGAASAGVGLGPKYFNDVLGVAKAYITRVGEGPFPTEIRSSVGSLIAKRGAEFGSVTGRERRVGWFDCVAMKKSIQINGISKLCITKLDVLDELEKILICISYESNIEISEVALDPSLCKPVYEEMDGWMCSTKDFTEWSSLPKNARLYLDRLATVLQLPISMVSTGPERESIIFKH